MYMLTIYCYELQDNSEKKKCKECGHRRANKKKSRRRSRDQIIDTSMVDAMMQL